MRRFPAVQKIVGALTLVAALLVLPEKVPARSGYLTAWSGEYSASTSDTSAGGCALCHGGSNSTWNPYGWRIRQDFLGGMAILDAIRAAEGLDSDGDPGAFTNLQEIQANA
jgi:hypothetical protein